MQQWVLYCEGTRLRQRVPKEISTAPFRYYMYSDLARYMIFRDVFMVLVPFADRELHQGHLFPHVLIVCQDHTGMQLLQVSRTLRSVWKHDENDSWKVLTNAVRTEVLASVSASILSWLKLPPRDITSFKQCTRTLALMALMQVRFDIAGPLPQPRYGLTVCWKTTFQEH